MANGGIIGPINTISRGGNKVTSVTSSGNHCFQSGTKFINIAVVGGGGSGGNTGGPSNNIAGGGGGAGGLSVGVNRPVSGGQVPVTIGAGGAASSGNDNAGSDSSITIDCTAIPGKGGGVGGDYASGTGCTATGGTSRWPRSG